MNLYKHIWEGWLVIDFINVMEFTFDRIMDNKSHVKPFESKQEIKDWCNVNQPYYKKDIPEVNRYFIEKYNKRINESL